MPEYGPLQADDPASLGGHTLLGRLASGGQGVVYVGLSPQGRMVAVKILHERWDGSTGGSRYDLRREVDAARRVAPFCTAQILDAQLDDDPQYVVSEYVDGPPLSRQVDEHGPLAGAALDRLAIATATALVAIHGAGVVHRDVKPANILLGPDGPRVIDFGIARHALLEVTQTQSLRGTPLYMAPEQFAGQPATSASDVFAWAATLAFAATGRAAFAGPTVPAVAHRVCHGEPDLDGVPEPLLGVLRGCLARDPQQRPDAPHLLMALLGQPLAATAETRDARATASAALNTLHEPSAAPPGHAADPATAPAAVSATDPATASATVPADRPGPWNEATSRMAAGAAAVDEPGPGRRSRGGKLLAAAGTVTGVVVLALAGTLAAGLLPGGGEQVGPGGDPTATSPAAQAPAATTGEPSGQDSTPSAATGSGAAPGTSGGGDTGPTAGGPTVPAAAAGVWTGTMSQAGLVSWTARATLTAGSGSGVFEAVELGCRSRLTLTSRTATTLTFEQARLPGSGAVCAEAGTLTLTLATSSMDALWQDATSPLNTATGTLRRR